MHILKPFRLAGDKQELAQANGTKDCGRAERAGRAQGRYCAGVPCAGEKAVYGVCDGLNSMLKSSDIQRKK